MRVLVVDDSVVFRSQVKAALDGISGIEVIGTANNGRIALQKLAQSSVDLVTLDMEMPEMGGIETIKEIRKAKFPVRIIVFSSHTPRGSEGALEALATGADDFCGKPTAGSSPEPSLEGISQKIRGELLPKVLQFVPRATITTVEPKSTLAPVIPIQTQTYASRDLATFNPTAIVIGSSTGGPPALEKALSHFSLPYRLPILIAQHMPPFFTASLAKRLQETTGMEACEGKHEQPVEPGKIYVAPGNFHMGVKKVGTQVLIQINQDPPRNSVRPAVDTLFESAAEVYGYRTMGVILTGMGEDGLVGARKIKSIGGGILIQDRASCVVFGMPGAIFDNKLYDGMGNLTQINQILKRMGL